MDEVKRFETKPVVIDWLQWAEHPEKLGHIDGPQITLLLIKEYEDAYQALLEKFQKAKAALEEIAKFGSSEGDTKVDPPRFQIARETLAEISK